MSTVDSNKENKVELKAATGPVAPKIPPAPNSGAVPPQPDKVKSYTERFIDMETMIARMTYAMNFQAKTIQGLMEQMTAVNEELERLTLVRKSVNAIMKISEEAKGPFSLELVAEKVEALEIQASKDQIAKDLAEGLVEARETIENDLSVFEFKSVPEGNYGIANVGTLNPELKKELMGKKVGDVVKNLEITGIYVYNLEKAGKDAKAQQDADKTATQGN